MIKSFIDGRKHVCECFRKHGKHHLAEIAADILHVAKRVSDASEEEGMVDGQLMRILFEDMKTLIGRLDGAFDFCGVVHTEQLGFVSEKDVER